MVSVCAGKPRPQYRLSAITAVHCASVIESHCLSIADALTHCSHPSRTLRALGILDGFSLSGAAIPPHHREMPRKDRSVITQAARAALIVAAMRRSILTYTELGKAIGIEKVELRNELRHVLDEVSMDCNARGEPSLAALVVNQRSGKPGTGWRDGARPWSAEVQDVFQRWH
jgi:hypothetical protein